MKRPQLPMWLWVIGTAAPLTTAAAPSFQGLGDFPGGNGAHSDVTAVSADGSTVIGTADIAPNWQDGLPIGSGRGYLWTRSAGITSVNSLDFFTGVDLVSADGSVFVSDYQRTTILRVTVSGSSIQWDACYGMRYSAIPTGISDDGRTILYVDGDYSRSDSYLWLPSGARPTIARNAHGTGLSADGTAVSGYTRPSLQPREAFRWTSTGGMQMLGLLPGGTWSEGWCISGDGLTIAGYGDNAAGVRQAFRWTQEDGLQSIGNLPGGGVHSRAGAISHDGSLIVGTAAAYLYTGESVTNRLVDGEAFIWDATHGMRSIHDMLVKDYGLDLGQWILTEAIDISADGRTIVGNGLNPDGLFEGWIATIPEPATVALLAMGAALFLRPGRRRLRVFGLVAACAVAGGMTAPAKAECGFDWAPGSGLGGARGVIACMAVRDEPAGPALYVGGRFDFAGTVPANNVAKWNGTSWEALGNGLPVYGDWSFSSLVFFRGELIASGRFHDGARFFYIARWDGTAWTPIVIDSSVLARPKVNSLFVYNDELVVAGEFTSAGGIPANNIARWDGTTWSTLGEGVDGAVSRLLIYEGRLVVGGAFVNAGGASANRIAAWDGATWSTFGSGPSGLVSSLANWNGYLVAGSPVQRWTGSKWIVLGAGMGAGALYAFNGDLYGSSIDGIVRWRRTIWWCSPTNDRPYCFTEYKGKLIRAGESIRVLEGTEWVPFQHTEWAIKALTAHQGQLFACGDFEGIGGIAASRIARWDGARWSALGTGLNEVGFALASYEGDLIAGGEFSEAGGGYGSKVARWDGTKWSEFYPRHSLSGNAYALLVSGDDLIVGGGYGAAYSESANRVVRWNGNSWQALGAPGAGVPFYVYALANYKGDIIAAGYYTPTGGTRVIGISRWNGTEWLPLGSGLSGGSNGTALALAVYHGDLFVGGLFTTAGGVPVNNIARWDGASWSAPGGGLDGTVRTLTVHADALIAGGDFTKSGATPTPAIARWDGANWSSLGNGLTPNASTFAMLSTGTELIVAGTFIYAGDQVSAGLARWAALGPRSITDLDMDCDVDRNDVAAFQPCATGAAIPSLLECTGTDFDHDGDVDADDFGILQRCYSGAGHLADAACGS